MKRIFVTGSMILALAGLGLTGCGTAATAQETTPPTAVAQQATAAPSPTTAPQEAATAQAGGSIDFGISGVGEVKAAQDADLVFLVQGTVAQVAVKEGDSVKQGDVLASLDTRTFDAQVAQAEAALASAQAQESALTEPPKVADAAAARAQVAQAQAQLQQVRSGAKVQDLQAAQAAADAAQTNVQSTRDRLSLAKTQSQSQLDQAVQALTAAQARYAQAKYNWDYVQETGNDPIVPNVSGPNGKKSANKLSEGQRQNYASQFQQAEAALKQAEENVQLAQAAFDTARQSEVTGIQAAEQQSVQAQAQLDKVKAGADNSQLAAAQAALAQAKAAQARLQPAPTNAQKAQVSAGIAQAQAALELAKINREHAEIRAPFDGLVSIVNVDPGDPSSVSGGGPVIKLVNVNDLHVDVQISDVDIGKVSNGQKVEVRVDALPDKVYPGRVTYIAPTATIQGTLRSYLVRVSLDSHENLRAGMSARVDIVSAAK